MNIIEHGSAARQIAGFATVHEMKVLPKSVSLYSHTRHVNSNKDTQLCSIKKILHRAGHHPNFDNISLALTI
jgi:hypothetical protein